MSSRLSPDHIAQILHALCDSPQDHAPNYHQQNTSSLSLTTEKIKAKTRSLNNSERTRLIEALRFNDLIHHSWGDMSKKYRPFAENNSGGRAIWEFVITKKGRTYLTKYDIFKQAHSQILIPGTVPSELEFEIIPGTIRPAQNRKNVRSRAEVKDALIKHALSR